MLSLEWIGSSCFAGPSSLSAWSPWALRSAAAPNAVRSGTTGSGRRIPASRTTFREAPFLEGALGLLVWAVVYYSENAGVSHESCSRGGDVCVSGRIVLGRIVFDRIVPGRADGTRSRTAIAQHQSAGGYALQDAGREGSRGGEGQGVQGNAEEDTRRQGLFRSVGRCTQPGRAEDTGCQGGRFGQVKGQDGQQPELTAQPDTDRIPVAPLLGRNGRDSGFASAIPI